MGKLIVIEGTDGSGKSTQLDHLIARLKKEELDFRKLRFPQYDKPSSALIRMYLGGEFGDDPNAVNAYAASTFYAVDRFASYAKDWKNYYNEGGVLLSDRYTTSNAVHQASKVPTEERDAFRAWLYDLEYNKMQLPKPDLVICLDMPTDLTLELMRGRESDTNTTADIHEKDVNYLRLCHQMALEAASQYNWSIISCTANGQMRSVADIHEEIYVHVKRCLMDSV